MTHEELQGLLPRYATGALSMAEAAPVQVHLATGCAACLAQVLDRPLGGRRAAPHPVVAPPAPPMAPAVVRAPPVDETVPAGVGDEIIPAVLVDVGDEIVRAVLVDEVTATLDDVFARAATILEPDVAPVPSVTALLLAPAPPLSPRPLEPAIEVAAATPPAAGHALGRGVAVALALAAGVGVGLWVRDARTREAARTAELVRATARLTAIEQQRAQLEDRLSAKTRELAATRAAFEKRIVTAPPPPAPPTVESQTSAPSAEAESDEGGVRYADDRLSVHVSGMPLDALILEVGRQAGAVVRGRTPDRKVSAQFDDVPLPAALERLLGTPNFSLVYDEQRRLRILDLLVPPVTPAVVAEPVAAPPPDPVRSAEAALPLIDQHPPIALAGSLARWFKTESLSLRELIETSFSHEDAAVRREALRTSLIALENDPALSGLLDDLARIDEATLETLARRLAGAHAEEVIRQVRMQSRRGDLRTKAGSVLERFHAEAGAPG